MPPNPFAGFFQNAGNLIHGAATGVGNMFSQFGNRVAQGVPLGQNIAQTAQPLVQPVENSIGQTAQDVGNVFAAPFQSAGAALGFRPPVSNQEMDRNTQSAMNAGQMVMGGAPEAPAAPSPSEALMGGRMAVNDMANATNDALDTARAQPGGFQAGFFKPGATVGEEAGASLKPEQISEANAKRNIQLDGKQIKSAEDVKKVNDAWNEYGGNGSAHEQVQNVFGKNGAMSKLGSQAEAQVAAEGGAMSREQIDNSVLNKLQGNVNATEIGAKDLQSGIQKYTDDVYNRAVGGNATPVTSTVPGSGTFTPTASWQELPKGIGELPSTGGFEQWTDPNSGKAYVKWDSPPKEPIPVQSQTITRLMPDQVPDAVQQKMARIMNQDAASTYTQPDATKWTPKQIIARNARDAFAENINTAHPGVGKLNQDMSHLYKGYDDMMTNANNESKAVAKAATQPKEPKGSNFWKNAAGVGTAVGGIGFGLHQMGVDVPGMVESGAKLLTQGFQNPSGKSPDGNPNASNQNPFKDVYGQSNQLNHSPNIPSTGSNVNNSSVSDYTQVQPGSDGQYHLTMQTQPSGIYKTDAWRQEQEKGLTPGTPAWQQIENDYKTSQTQASNYVNNAKDFLQQVTPAISVGNRLAQEIKDYPPNLFTKDTTIKDIIAYNSSSNNPQALTFSDIDALNQAFATGKKDLEGSRTAPGSNQTINLGDSPNQMFQKWTRIMQYLTWNHDKLNDAYLSITTPTGTTTDMGAPVAPPSRPARAPSDASGMYQGAQFAPLFQGNASLFNH